MLYRVLRATFFRRSGTGGFDVWKGIQRVKKMPVAIPKGLFGDLFTGENGH